jgi:hypothetical protein
MLEKKFFSLLVLQILKLFFSLKQEKSFLEKSFNKLKIKNKTAHVRSSERNNFKVDIAKGVFSV